MLKNTNYTIQELFRKYLDGQCSASEVKELLKTFDVPENEMSLRALIAESLENMDDDDNAAQWSPAIDETFAAIKKQVNAERGKLVPMARRTWFRVAAVVVLLAGGFAVYNLIKNRDQQQDIVKTDASRQGTGPGSNKAVLTLADGSTINLETAANGTITQQGTAKILKPADGQLSYKALNEKPTEILFNSIVTPRGGQYQVILSDGSKVWLNAASSLRFPATFTGSERKVALTGEAYFEVAKNASMPFKVAVGGKSEVEVLGTNFNVNAYIDEPTVNTTLQEGRLKVVVLATRDMRIIASGEQTRFGGNGQIIIDRNADTEEAMAWKNGVFSFNKADLGMVLRQLSRWYDVDILFEGSLPKMQFSGEIQRDLELPRVLKLLEINNVSCRLEGRKLIVL